MNFVLGVAVNAFAVWVAVGVVGGLEFSGDFWKLVLIAVILGAVNAAIKPVLKVLSIPLIVVTMGLFLLVINWLMFALVIWLAAPDRLDLGLTSTGFWATFFGALIVSIASWIASAAVSK
jgi:putative membrane protein